jgi:hypothetical protein
MSVVNDTETAWVLHLCCDPGGPPAGHQPVTHASGAQPARVRRVTHPGVSARVGRGGRGIFQPLGLTRETGERRPALGTRERAEAA